MESDRIMTISLSTYKTRSHLTRWKLSDGALYTPNQNQSTSHTHQQSYMQTLNLNEREREKEGGYFV